MRHLTLALFVLAAVSAAHAQYKCVAPDGKVAFQQTPCAAGATQQALDIRVAPPPASAPGDEPRARPPTADERILASYVHQRKLLEAQRHVAQLERRITARSALMEAELDVLRARKLHTNNNLAGATLDQSISTEMAAVVAKHRALNEVDLARLQRARAALTELQASAPAR